LVGTGLVVLAASTGVPVSAAGAASKHHRARPHHRAHQQAYTGAIRKGHRPRFVEVPLFGRGGGGDPGDDYPAALKNRPQDSIFDQWREYNRECTSFVAWALASRNGFTMPFFANANNWGPMARARGFAVNATPTPGSVAWSNAGTFGHVAYVQDVTPAGVHIEEYNHDFHGHYSSRVVPAGTFTAYIHFADRPAEPEIAPTPPPAAPPPPVVTPTPAPTPNPTPAPSPTTYSETTGGVANTWTNYTNAGGTHGPSIPSNATVQIACKLTGFRVADGNTWWYRIASSPWNGSYYVSADAFYNNGQTSGSLQGTPFVDPNVRDC
jgi:surface antigen